MIPLVTFEDEYFDLFLANLPEDFVGRFVDALERTAKDGEGIDETTD